MYVYVEKTNALMFIVHTPTLLISHDKYDMFSIISPTIFILEN